MKNLFSFNVKTEEQPYNNYIVKKTDSSVTDKQTETLKKVNEFQKKYSLPVYFKVIMYICGFAAVIIFFSVIRACAEGTPVSKAYRNAPYLFYIGGAGLLIFLILFGISRFLVIKGQKDPELQIIAQQVENTVVSSFEDLGVPDGAAEISVIIYAFKTNKKGKEKPASPFMKYSAHEMKLYADTETLYLADIYSVTAIPFSDIRQIVENRKRVQIPEWTKDEKPNSPKYKPYKVRAFQYGFTVGTYSMQISFDGDEREVVFPNYEIETLKTYVDAPVTEIKQKKNKKDNRC